MQNSFSEFPSFAFQMSRSSAHTLQIPDSLAHFNVDSSSYLNSLRAESNGLNTIVVGVLVFKGSKVLLLQRAASETNFPNMWELPSGKVKVGETLLNGGVRECKEETGLTVTKFLGQAESFRYTAGERNTLQLNFIIGVDEREQVQLRPKEHQNYEWFAAAKVEAMPIHGEKVAEPGISDKTREVLRASFLWAATCDLNAEPA